MCGDVRDRNLPFGQIHGDAAGIERGEFGERLFFPGQLQREIAHAERAVADLQRLRLGGKAQFQRRGKLAVGDFAGQERLQVDRMAARLQIFQRDAAVERQRRGRNLQIGLEGLAVAGLKTKTDRRGCPGRGREVLHLDVDRLDALVLGWPDRSILPVDPAFVQCEFVDLDPRRGRAGGLSGGFAAGVFSGTFVLSKGLDPVDPAGCVARDGHGRLVETDFREAVLLRQRFERLQLDTDCGQRKHRFAAIIEPRVRQREPPLELQARRVFLLAEYHVDLAGKLACRQGQVFR